MKKVQLTFLLVLNTVVVFAQNRAANGKEEEPESIFNVLTVSTALIAVAALILSVMMYRNLARLLNSVGRRKVDIKILQDEMTEYKTHLAEQIAMSGSPVNSKAYEDRILQLEKKLAAMEGRAHADIASNIETKGPSSKLYARMPDMKNAFSVDVLQNKAENDSVYELQISGDKGKLVVSADEGIQRFAMTDYQYYLGNGCTMTNEPFKGAKIVLKEPGLLNKTNYGWDIIKKPVITFS